MPLRQRNEIYPITHNPNLTMREKKKKQKNPECGFLQNAWPLLLKTVKVFRNRADLRNGHRPEESKHHSCLTLCSSMDCSTSGFPVLHCLPEFAQTHILWVGDTIQPSHPLLPASPPSLNLSQHQGLWKLASNFIPVLGKIRVTDPSSIRLQGRLTVIRHLSANSETEE